MSVIDTEIKKPIRIGYTLSLSGPVAENAWSAWIAHQLWREEVNKKGGILGRPVELICYDDKADPILVEKLYKKLLDEEYVDLVSGGYGTNTIAASLPVVIDRNKFIVGLMGLGVNKSFGYSQYFAMIPTGPSPNAALTEGFFEIASLQMPALKTVALLTAEAEFSKNPVIGAKENALKYGLEIVYEHTYPLKTENFAPYIKELQAVNADVLFLCSYLKDSINLVRGIRAGNYFPKLAGGAMIGPQTAVVKTVLGPLLNGFVNYEYWVPVPSMMFTGVSEMLDKYQQRASESGAQADQLGHYVAPLAYAQMQVIEQAIKATGSISDQVLSRYCSTEEFDTVAGLVKFGADGEWAVPRVLQVQYQNITGNSIDTFRDGSTQVILTPKQYVSGSIIH